MKNLTNYQVAFGSLLMFFFTAIQAQDNKNSLSDVQNQERMEQYDELAKLGYNDNEIFEDLGNANFLMENFDSAVFWYQKLIDLGKHKGFKVGTSYLDRMEYALGKTGARKTIDLAEEKDWLAAIQDDYKVKQEEPEPSLTEKLARGYQQIGYASNNNKALEELVRKESGYEGAEKDNMAAMAPIAIAPDGKSAYFTKSVLVKPMYGAFSKKELVNKIYRVDKVNGEWKNIQEVAVAPKNSNSMHPAISKDGKRLFFASDMPGTYGEFDIYVAEIHNDGTYGQSKNLGEKINTKQNDMFPNITEDNSLYYASNGRDGFGGLDIYMAQVDHKKVSKSVHLGSPINSSEDDFAIFLMAEKGMGYVMSNRGNNQEIGQPIAFAYTNAKTERLKEEKEYIALEALNAASEAKYTSTIFED